MLRAVPGGSGNHKQVRAMDRYVIKTDNDRFLLKMIDDNQKHIRVQNTPHLHGEMQI